MKNFLVLYNASPESMAEWRNAPKEEQEKGMQEWMAWQERNKEAIVTLGNPVGKNYRLTSAGSNQESNDIGGYSILQGESVESVMEVLKDNPHLGQNGAYMEVMEIVNM